MANQEQRVNIADLAESIHSKQAFIQNYGGKS